MIFYILIFIMLVASIYLLANTLLDLRSGPRLRLDMAGPALRRPGFFSGQARPLPKFLSPLNKPIQAVSKWAYLQKLQSQADILRIEVNMAGVVIFKFLLGSALGAAAFAALPRQYALPAIIIGFFIPDFLMWRKIKAKKEHIGKVFPETVDLLDMCISAGQDFLSAIKWLIEKSDPNPFIEQLGVVLGEVQVGKTRSDALKDMAKRLKLPDISSFVRTIIQAERMGTSIEEAFRNLSDDTRDRRFQSGERYAIKASLKILFPLLFCILPAIMIVVAGPVIIKFMQGDMIPKTKF
jgi:Flp pilus assembly protein TadB